MPQARELPVKYCGNRSAAVKIANLICGGVFIVMVKTAFGTPWIFSRWFHVKVLILIFQEGEEPRLEDILPLLAGGQKPVRYEIGTQTVRSFPGLEIFLREQTVICGGKPVHLSHYEFFTLWFLTEHPGWVFTKNRFMKRFGTNLATLAAPQLPV